MGNEPPSIDGIAFGEELGRGGMGTVYAATQLSLDRPVAVKVLAGDLSRDEGFRARFRREAKTHGRFQHPHVVSVHEFGESGSDLYLVMELIEGRDLRKILDDGPMEPERALAVLAQIASALDAARERHLVHRDVKPHNILVTSTDVAYLSDFGLSRTASEAGFSRAGSVSGSMDYLAPEQIRGEVPAAPADVYGLAAVLYQSLTGERPFPLTTHVAVMFAHTNDPPPRPSTVLPSLPVALDDVIAGGMAKDPDARPATATELIDRARAAFAEPRPVAVPARKHAWPRWVAASLIGLAVLGTGAVAGRPSDDRPSTPTATRAESTRVQLDYRAPWRQASSPAAIPAVDHDVVLRSGDLELVAGTAAADDPLLLPAVVRDHVAKDVRPEGRVRVGPAEALRYDDLRLSGRHATLLAIPTQDDAVLVVCSRPGRLTEADRSACDNVARTVRLAGKPAVALGPSTAYADAMQRALEGFDQHRATLLKRLARAGKRATQARALDTFATECRASLKQVGAFSPGAQIRAIHARIVTAMSSTCEAFAAMARAAHDGSQTRYDTARHRTQRLKRELRRTVTALGTAGYDV